MAVLLNGADLASKVRDFRDFDAAYEIVSTLEFASIDEVVEFLYPKGEIPLYQHGVFDVVCDALSAYKANQEAKR